MDRHQLKRTLRTVFAVMVFATVLAMTNDWVNSQASRVQTTRRPPQPQVLDWEKLTEQQFKQLPDSQLIVFEDKQVKCELRLLHVISRFGRDDRTEAFG